MDVIALAASLAALGDAIVAVTDAAGPTLELTPDGPGDLTVTVGIGPTALAATRHPELAAAAELPEFAGDADLPADRRGGDLYLSVNASDPIDPGAGADPAAAGQSPAIRLRWSDFGYRGQVDAGVTRNPFGYHDGVIVPRTEGGTRGGGLDRRRTVAGGSVVVIRRFRLDTSAFRALPAERQDATIGRRRVDGAPLSGGGLLDQVDVNAKAENGDLLVPAGAHASAAHPSFTGSGLMLRRSYSFRTSATDAGHMFISFQNDVATFARTQLRLDEVDDLHAVRDADRDGGVRGPAGHADAVGRPGRRWAPASSADPGSGGAIGRASSAICRMFEAPETGTLRRCDSFFLRPVRPDGRPAGSAGDRQ